MVNINSDHALCGCGSSCCCWSLLGRVGVTDIGRGYSSTDQGGGKRRTSAIIYCLLGGRTLTEAPTFTRELLTGRFPFNTMFRVVRSRPWRLAKALMLPLVFDRHFQQENNVLVIQYEGAAVISMRNNLRERLERCLHHTRCRFET
jgi:hypothetical protein